MIRRVAASEPHNYLHRDVEIGEVFYEFHGATYGCIDDCGGIALSERANENPFFEFPTDAIERAGRDLR